ncbi:MAG: ATP-binding protein, partial [Candidatus Promineifilaceae bacterium]
MGENEVWRESLGDVSLTERELEVLRLKARRRTNAEIAEQLILSLTTVKWYVRQIYNKLGVRNRAEAVEAARQLGMLDQRDREKDRRRYKLPVAATPFIGRKAELQDLLGLIGRKDAALITLTGPGGIGKTRLALQAAHLLDGRIPGGICWLTFSAQDGDEYLLTTAEDYIVSSIAAALGLATRAGEEPRRLLQSHLAKNRPLIILDSFEPLIAGAPLIEELLAGAPGSRFLLTSRERLQLRSEIVFPVPPLSQLPAPGRASAESDAVKLFLQTAGRVSAEEIAGAKQMAAIQRICARLEGIPLAIELAADWTRLLLPAEIEQELAQDLSLLGIGSSALRGVLDRSWSLLTEEQRGAFARLAVFQRGFTRDAAMHVAGADLNTLAALYDKSLLFHAGDGRYTMHDLLRGYAAGRLAGRGEWEMMRDAHCAYFANLAAAQMAQIQRGDHHIVLAEIDNLRASWQWAVQTNQFNNLRRMIFPLGWFFNMRAQYAEAARIVGLALETSKEPNPQGIRGIVYGMALAELGLQQSRIIGADQVRADVRAGLSILRRQVARKEMAWYQVLAIMFGVLGLEEQEGELLALEGQDIFRQLDDPSGIAYACAILGTHYRRFGRFAEAKRCIEQAAVTSSVHGDKQGTAVALRHLGRLNLTMGSYPEARENFTDEARLWRELSLPRLEGEALTWLGESILADGQIAEAESTLLQSLAAFEDLGDQGNALRVLLDLAQLALQRGRAREARERLGDAEAKMVGRSDSRQSVRFWQL